MSDDQGMHTEFIEEALFAPKTATVADLERFEAALRRALSPPIDVMGLAGGPWYGAFSPSLAETIRDRMQKMKRRMLVTHTEVLGPEPFLIVGPTTYARLEALGCIVNGRLVKLPAGHEMTYKWTQPAIPPGVKD